MRNGGLIILIGIAIVYLAATGRMSQIVNIVRGRDSGRA